MTVLSWAKASYIIYTMCFFRTKYSVNYPMSTWIQNQNFDSFIQHPISQGDTLNRVCPLGKWVAVLLAVYILTRDYHLIQSNRNTDRLIWGSILAGSLLLNLNVFVYLLPVFLLDTYN